MNAFFKWYVSKSLLLRILTCFIVGALIGGVLWGISSATVGDGNINPGVQTALGYIAPFGTVFVAMLKMIVIPVIFFSLVTGAASLPISRFGKIGVKVIAWYFLTSLAAAIVGVILALAINPGAGTGLAGWETMATGVASTAEGVVGGAKSGGAAFSTLLMSMFENPFSALANGHFLAIIVFAVLFGLAIRVMIEAGDEKQAERFESFLDMLDAGKDVIFKLVSWVLEYSPIGVLALTIKNFGEFGPILIGPYVTVTAGVVGGILVMVLVVYPAFLAVVVRKNPVTVMRKMQEATLTAFITRSSAATLPVSLTVAERDLKIKNELASFSLPLGAPINMDGVCVHLPMFAVLAANMFGIDLSFNSLLLMVISTVLASVGAGGVPGGSLMLLFIILEQVGLAPGQVATVVALALGINPILDMFETANNVTGDLVCTYGVASREKMIEE
jgi:Na+/H+-dicarboxylate symporter